MKFLVEVDVNIEKLARSAEGDLRAADNGPPETQGDVIALLYQEFNWLAESGVAPLDIIVKPVVFTSWIAKDFHTSAAQSGHWCTDDEAEKLLNEASGQILEEMAESAGAIVDDLVSQQFGERTKDSFPEICPHCGKRAVHDNTCPYDLMEISDE
ncbi:MAG: hypothetical protein ABI623_08620 [bacterium]